MKEERNRKCVEERKKERKKKEKERKKERKRKRVVNLIACRIKNN